MKKSIIYIFIVVFLSALSLYLYRHNQRSSTFNSKVFSIADTTSITKIFLADKKNNKVILTRLKAGEWIVNNKFKIRNDAINMLLKTIKLVEIKNAVAKSAHNNVVKEMAARAVKMEVYTSDESDAELVCYIGGANQTTDGSYMLLEGSETPYVCYIPGFDGYLSTRFMVKENEWRNTEVFNYTNISQVKSVSVQYPKRPENSFEISIHNSNLFTIHLLQNGRSLQSFDTSALKDYLTGWRSINFEAFGNVSTLEKDSLSEIGPEYIFTMNMSDGTSKTISAFLKKPSLYAPLVDNRPNMQDLDRMYGKLSDEDDWVLIQFYVFDKLIVGVDYFVKGGMKKRENYSS